ncbi:MULTISPECIES: HlyU family transcriptional regulator [unclassified Chromohalobacter]|uniref:HlyU family transcriptional regulator n=1 Tax=unclassified Chromohalobacter TaxID=2628571 RepID=UPI002468B817|nr:MULTISPECIES: HlyU family transcriptional regulator [unclassified Chromohalobacter]
MLKRLIEGLFRSGGVNDEEIPATDYEGYLITPDPQDVGGQYRVSGWIRKPVEGGETREHRFERSDIVSSRDDCIELTLRKVQRYIDDVGDEMFEDR